jgi:transketolase
VDTNLSLEKLAFYARQIRKSTLEMTTVAGSGHVGGSLSVVDILTVLFFRILKHNSKEPLSLGRDRFILSSGHVCPAYYATLAHAGYIEKQELLSLRQLNSRLQGHPSHVDLPIIETASGSLGQGLSIALGKTLALRLRRQKSKVYCLMSDGEQEEGSVWETAMAASHYCASNLIAIVDRNSLQISGSTENIVGLAPLGQKYRSFGWQVIEADGHNFSSLIDAFEQAHLSKRQPSVIIAKTVMGKGVRSIENNYRWHGKVLNERELNKARNDLEANDRDKKHDVGSTR